MCGITGFVDYDNKLSLLHLKETVNLLRHRGPDYQGTYYKQIQNGCTIGLGHSRLAVIDLSKDGNQPFISGCGNFVLVFNGTIYNYKELRAELKSLGDHFETNSDTEVLLKAYLKWPDAFYDKINGVYAIAIFDRLEKKLHLFRDKIGVKPLFYYHNNSHFLFASELRVFLKQAFIEKKISQKALSLYLQYAYFPSPYTVLENVFKVPPGECITIDLTSNKLAARRFWNLTEKSDPLEFVPASIADSVKLKIEESVESRLVADTPIGILLSGGYDSSLVAAIAQKKAIKPLNTFTIGFEEKSYNEAQFAKKIASYLGTEHKELYFNQKLASELIQSLGKTFDEPMGDSGAIPLQLAAQLAAKDVKVLLSAEGGDELFGGYPAYFKALQVSSLSKFLPFSLQDLPRRYLNIFTRKDRFNTYKAFIQYFTRPEAVRLCGLGISHPYSAEAADDLNALLLFDLEHYLPDDLLMKTDRCTMASSIESRDPFLSIDLVKLVSNIPGNIKCPNGSPKQLLKQITHQYIPEQLLKRPKKGFSIPVGQWLSTFLSGFTEEKINNLAQRGILNPDSVSSTFEKFKQRPEKYYSRQVWILLALELWMEEWMD